MARMERRRDILQVDGRRDVAVGGAGCRDQFCDTPRGLAEQVRIRRDASLRPRHRAGRKGARRDHPGAVPASAKRLAAALPGGKRSDAIRRKDADILKLHADNNEHERFGAFKERVKRVSGFSSTLPTIAALLPAYYNLFRPFGHGWKDAHPSVRRGNRWSEQVARGPGARGPVLRVTYVA